MGLGQEMVLGMIALNSIWRRQLELQETGQNLFCGGIWH